MIVVSRTLEDVSRNKSREMCAKLSHILRIMCEKSKHIFVYASAVDGSVRKSVVWFTLFLYIVTGDELLGMRWNFRPLSFLLLFGERWVFRCAFNFCTGNCVPSDLRRDAFAVRKSSAKIYSSVDVRLWSKPNNLQNVFHRLKFYI